MSELEVIIQLAQKCLEAMPAIVLGSGASVPYGVSGMGALQSHLLSVIDPSSEDSDQWDAFKASIARTNDLEQSLQEIQCSPSLTYDIVRETRSMLIREDLAVFEKVVANPRELQLSRLYRHLFNSTHETLSIVTTNYDRLAEYAADAAHVSHNVGFSRGYLRSFLTGHATTQSRRYTRTVNIWKVHGSLDWFSNQDRVAFAMPFQEDFPDALTPLLVTPGTTKYEETHLEPFRTIMTMADSALEEAAAYLCIGFGFNDDHIQPKLVQRVRHQAIPIVVLARTLTPKAREFLDTCKESKFLALERSGSATRAFFPNAPNGVDLPNTELWNLTSFLDATTS